MKESEKKRFRELTDKHGLTSEDFWFSPQGWAIISRQGIEKIQTSIGLKVVYEVELALTELELKTICIKAIATQKDTDLYIETYGESNPLNVKGGAKGYPVAMAEKRALSRAVLKASHLYQFSKVMGEDEASGSEQRIPNEPSQGLQRMAESPVTRTK